MTENPIARVRLALQEQLVTAILGNERVARRYGLLVTDLQTLHLLVMRPDVRTPRQISEVTTMPTSTVTKLIDRLETAGYVRRTSDPADRRRTVLELVEENIAPLHDFYGKSSDEFDALSSKFSSEELETVAQYLEAVSSFYKFDPTSAQSTE
ncbi:MarR family winged helix-turn-helix transcriptional regulator [Paenarthrobacter nitroguajacolicus]|uniref:MarR family winged helix-turn-helix transcriptional regulator n=1 Tax=Paenarthrobacter nitroguajacolicus TaxID=211146 RepID=UPI00405453AD